MEDYLKLTEDQKDQLSFNLQSLLYMREYDKLHLRPDSENHDLLA